jgi:hypothetical protein
MQAPFDFIQRIRMIEVSLDLIIAVFNTILILELKKFEKILGPRLYVNVCKKLPKMGLESLSLFQSR